MWKLALLIFGSILLWAIACKIESYLKRRHANDGAP